MLDRGAGDAVRLTGSAVLLGKIFGNEEQADALYALGGVGQAGEHEMDDILGQVMLTGGDEDLGAGDLVAAIALRDRAAAQEPEIGTAMRLGQAHRAGPLTAYHLGQVGLLERVAPMALDRSGRTMGEARIEAEGKVGRADHLFDQLVDRFRQPLPTPFWIGCERGPATFGELLIGLREPRRRPHNAVFQMASFLVARPIDRQEHVATEARRLLEDGIGQIRRELRQRGNVPEAVIGMEFVEHEAHIAQRGVIDLHIYIS